jgi:hypothetical protein
MAAAPDLNFDGCVMPQLEQELRSLQQQDQRDDAQVAMRMKKRARKSAEKQVFFFRSPRTMLVHGIQK